MNPFSKAGMSSYVEKAFLKDYIIADRVMLYLLLFHWWIATFITSIEYSTYMYGFINGGLIFTINALVYKWYKGTHVFRCSVAISMMLFSSIFIQQHLGRIEMHFHVFIALALLTLYKDTYPLIIATLTTLIHHILFNYLQLNNVYVFDMPINIFSFGCGWDTVVLHSTFAIIEGAILIYIVRMQIINNISLIESKYHLKQVHDKVKNEIKQNEKLSKESRQFASALEESTIISKTDTRGVITYVNKKFCDVSGYSREELLGTCHNIIRHPDMPDDTFGKLWETISSKHVFKGLIKNKKKNGEAYYVDTVIMPVLDVNDEIEEYVALRYDVTELVQAREEALQAQKAKDDFLANMSHELRTPLNAIIGFTKLANKTTDLDEVHQFLNVSLDSSNILLELINNILDISKIKDGKFSIVTQPFIVNESLTKLLKTFEPEYSKKNIYFEFILDDTIKTTLNGDWQRISQIIMNLLSNAIKFTPDGGNIKVISKYKNGIFECSVIDSGIGLSEDAQKRVFNAFEQADYSTTKEYGGTGLGLSISLQLAHLMGGDLSLKSKEGEGSLFSLTIPLQQIEGTQNQNDMIDDTHDLKKTTLSGHILVAEDNKTNQMLLKILLEEFGLTCDIAEDGQEAVDMYDKNKYDLVLMDESMPNMSGTHAMQIIRKKYKETAPIIVQTANNMNGDREKFIEIGMDDFIEKPIDEQNLYEVLKKYL